MRASIYIISTGTELSSGRSRDTNAPFIASRLAEKGFSISGFATLPDDSSILKRELSHLLSRPQVDAIVMTGGLGATEDDCTVATLAELLGSDIVEESESLRRLELLARRYPRRLNFKTIRQQVRIVSGAMALANRVGIAPGMLIEHRTGDRLKYIAAMPGVPQEMSAMLDSQLFPLLEQRYPTAAKNRILFYLYGLGEVEFQERFFGDCLTASRGSSSDTLATAGGLTAGMDIPADFRWGIAAGAGALRIFMEAASKEILQELQALAAREFADHFLEARAEQLLHTYCIEQGIRIATAESCSGGLAARILTDRPGSSRYFEGGIVSYSNALKHTLLGVPKDILERYGAVSRQCAACMAENALRAMNVDFALSITGIAGPGGGSQEKPVGLVFMAYAGTDCPVQVRRWNWPLDRDRIREYSAHLALFGLYKYIRYHSNGDPSE